MKYWSLLSSQQMKKIITVKIIIIKKKKTTHSYTLLHTVSNKRGWISPPAFKRKNAFSSFRAYTCEAQNAWLLVCVLPVTVSPPLLLDCIKRLGEFKHTHTHIFSHMHIATFSPPPHIFTHEHTHFLSNTVHSRTWTPTYTHLENLLRQAKTSVTDTAV